jgi:hypothetical protein
MLEIDVYFGLNKVGDPKDVLVQPDPAALHSGDDIFWHFHSLDKNVEYVRIEFADNTVLFFDERGHKKTFQRKTQLEKPPKGNKGGHGRILGTAPSYGGGTQSNKYSVKAFDTDPGDVNNPNPPNPIYEMDPTVITCDP